MSDLVAAFRRCRVHDASPTLATGMAVFPGHPAVELALARTHAEDGYFVQALRMGEHTGSHVDAPAHALADRPELTIDTFSAARFVVPYAILDLAPLGLEPGELASGADIRAAAGQSAPVEPGDAVLLHYGWDRHRDAPDGWWSANTPGLAEDACALVAGWKVGLVGSDTPTCDAAVIDGRIVAEHGHLTYFLPNGILLVEGLLGLADAPRRGLLVAAPLKLEGGSGAPARVLLIAEEEDEEEEEEER